MKILWAIDPISSDSSIQELTGRVIKAWALKLSAEVQPIYVRIDPFASLSYTGFLENAQKKVSEWKTRLEFANLLPLKIIGPAGSRSITDRVQCLINYAQESKADLIVSSTRAKTGVSRWLLGSFAETLALQSETPMLFINPSIDPKASTISLDRILFPTDLTDESHQAFRLLLPIAKALGSRIEIFHQYRFALSPSLDFAALAATYISEDTVKAEIEESRAIGNRWADEGLQYGVDTVFKLKDSPAEPVTETILEESANMNGMIAMAAVSNSVEVNLLGSITRQVIRSSRLPVWVIRAQADIE